MVHDRRINGETFVFGNQGGLFMNAMTWWDHKTGSVWSQVWGQAIAGELKGTTLDLIPAAIVPWSTWKANYPDTLAMTNEKGGVFSREEPARDGWVIGITLGEHSKAYDYSTLSQERVINDFVGPFPVVLYADPQSRDVQAYVRQIDQQVLSMRLSDSGQYLIDAETDTAWNVTNGLAKEGEFKGESLLKVPYISSFDWAWEDFYPNTGFYP